MTGPTDPPSSGRPVVRLAKAPSEGGVVWSCQTYVEREDAECWLRRSPVATSLIRSGRDSVASRLCGYVGHIAAPHSGRTVRSISGLGRDSGRVLSSGVGRTVAIPIASEHRCQSWVLLGRLDGKTYAEEDKNGTTCAEDRVAGAAFEAGGSNATEDEGVNSKRCESEGCEGEPKR